MVQEKDKPKNRYKDCTRKVLPKVPRFRTPLGSEGTFWQIPVKVFPILKTPTCQASRAKTKTIPTPAGFSPM